MQFKVRSKFWIVDGQGQPIFGGGKEKILRRIDELGSIKAAAENLNMSYRAVWGKIKATEERLGLQLVHTSRGGGPDRGARLTPEARELLRMFQQLHEQGNQQADELFARLFTRPPGSGGQDP